MQNTTKYGIAFSHLSVNNNNTNGFAIDANPKNIGAIKNVDTSNDVVMASVNCCILFCIFEKTGSNTLPIASYILRIAVAGYVCPLS